MKVLAWVPQAFDTSPGQRFRIEQWAPHLQREGIDITWSPFADEALARQIQRPGAVLSKASAITAALAGRVREAWGSAGYDLVYIFRESALMGPAVAERILARAGIPFVFDFDDAVWVRYVSPANSVLSYLRFPGKTATSCRRARHVMAGNRFLHDYATRYNRHVTVVPTTIDTSKYQPVSRVSEQRPVIGWTGSYSTEKYLNAVAPALSRLARKRDFRVVIVGGSTFQAEGVEVLHRPWRSETEVRDLADFDIGIMPLADSVWEHGKCGLKALQYMALGIPVVASPVGVNTEIVVSGDNGFLASDPSEWETSLDRLLADAALRRQLGSRGRTMVETSYSAVAHAPRVAAIFREAGR